MRKNKTLTLAGRQLTEVPNSVFITAQEESVGTIDLSKNNLKEVPEG